MLFKYKKYFVPKQFLKKWTSVSFNTKENQITTFSIYIHKTIIKRYNFNLKLNNIYMPAFIEFYKNGSKSREMWYKNGKRHREEDAAWVLYYTNGIIEDREYFIDGFRLSQEEFRYGLINI